MNCYSREPSTEDLVFTDTEPKNELDNKIEVSGTSEALGTGIRGEALHLSYPMGMNYRGSRKQPTLGSQTPLIRGLSLHCWCKAQLTTEETIAFFFIRACRCVRNNQISLLRVSCWGGMSLE